MQRRLWGNQPNASPAPAQHQSWNWGQSNGAQPQQAGGAAGGWSQNDWGANAQWQQQQQQAPTATASWSQQEEEVDDEKTFYAYYAAIGADGAEATGTLVGRYREEGVNHGRKYYRKQLQGTGEEQEVYLYYWDERDGADLNGWWFGNMVGGRQVWARNSESSPLPPTGNWNIPWDGQVQPEFCVTGLAGKRQHDNKVKEEITKRKQQEAKAEQRRQEIWQWQQRLNSCTDHVGSVEKAVGEVLAQAKHCLDNNVEVSVMDAALAPLKQQTAATIAAQRILQGEARVIVQNAPELKEEMLGLTNRIKVLQSKIKESSDSLGAARNAKAKALEDAKQAALDEARNKELEPVHTKRFQELTEAFNGTLTFAEDEVEKVAIAAAPLEVETGEADLEQAMKEALNETETRFAAAYKVLTEMRSQITQGQKEVAQFVPSIVKAATEQFDEFQSRYTELMEKLNPFKTVRKDFLQRAKDKSTLDELSEKVVSVEVQVDQAEAAPLESQADIKEVEKSVTAASSQLHLASKSIEKKYKEITASARPGQQLKDQATELYERSQQLKERVEKTTQNLKATRLKLVADTLVQDVGKKVTVVEDGLTKLAELVVPEAQEDASIDEIKRISAVAEKVATEVKVKLAEAQAYMAMKVAETKRLSQDAGGAILQEIETMKGRLEEGKKKLEEFKSNLSERMRSAMLKEVESGTSATELEEVRLKELVGLLSDTVGEPASPEMLAALQAAVEAERSAKSNLVIAHKALSAKTIELKKLAGASVSSGTELGKLQNRQSAVFRAIMKHEAVIKKTEESLRIKDLLSEFVDKLRVGEEEVEKAVEAALPLQLAEEEPSPEACKALDTIAKSADMKLKTTIKLVDLKLRSAKAVSKDELTAIRKRLTLAEEKLTGLVDGVKEQQERSRVNELILEVNDKVEAAESLLERARSNHSEKFGEENGELRDRSDDLAALEAILAETKAAYDDAQASTTKQLAVGKTLSALSAGRIKQELGIMQTRLDQVSSQLADFKNSSIDAKRQNRNQMVTSTQADVEKKVAAFKILMAKPFSDEQLASMPEDELSKFRDRMRAADKGSQSALNKAKAFVEMQQKEARSLPNEERQSATKELAAMQTKLTQLQIEVSKLSSRCEISEQRFAARLVVKETEIVIEGLQKDTLIGTTIGDPLTKKENRPKVIGDMLLQDVVFSLEEYIASAGIELSELLKKISDTDRGVKKEFISFIQQLVEMTGRKDLEFTDKQANDMFNCIASDAEDGSFEMEVIKQLFLPRYVCTHTTSFWKSQKEGEKLGSLEQGEIVRLFKPPSGSARVQCILGRDNSKAWVDPLNDEEDACFKRSENAAWQLDSIEAFSIAVHARCTQAAQSTDKLVADVKAATDGPLAAVKGKVQQLRMRITAEQARASNTKKLMQELKTTVYSNREKELKTVKEAQMKDNVLSNVSAASKSLEEAEAKITSLTDGTKGKDMKKDFSKDDLMNLKKEGEEAVKNIATAKEKIAKALKFQEELPPAIKSQVREVRIDCAKMNSRATTGERRLKTVFENLEAAMEADLPVEIFIQGKAAKDDAIGWIMLVDAEGVKYASESSDFYKCKAATALTDNVDIQKCKPIRKIEVGEVLELAETEETAPVDEASGIKTRIHVRAAKDGKVGWATVQGSRGTVFLEAETAYKIEREVPLRTLINVDSKLKRPMEVGELFNPIGEPKEQKKSAGLSAMLSSTGEPSS
mmetsp:Transcript_15185/g.24021  ORF Transcript_15185/g.24021 Transcript_15185/m.24021 type:complete len:1722 (+) Transcript_15185:1-5166(+)